MVTIAVGGFKAFFCKFYNIFQVEYTTLPIKFKFHLQQTICIEDFS